MKERFLSKVNKTAYCWDWIGSIGSTGYGRFSIKSKYYKAHRISYILFKGEIPTNKLVLHTCDNRICVNPEHLFIGSQSENLYDMYNKKRRDQYLISCKGSKHPNSKLTEDNVKFILNSNESDRKLGEYFNVSKTLIHLIRKRKIWKHASNVC